MERRQSHASPDLRASHSVGLARPCVRIFVCVCLFVAASQLDGCNAQREQSARASASETVHGAAPATALPQRASYAVDTGSGTVATYKPDPATGELRRKGYADASSVPRSITIGPSGKFAYAANDFSDEVSVFAIDAATGMLTRVGISIATGIMPQGVAVDPSGKFAYVANFGSNDVSAYAINPETGALTPIGQAVAAGINPVSVRVDPDGSTAMVSNFDSPDVLAYRIDPATGALTAAGAGKSAAGNPFSAFAGDATRR